MPRYIAEQCLRIAELDTPDQSLVLSPLCCSDAYGKTLKFLEPPSNQFNSTTRYPNESSSLVDIRRVGEEGRGLPDMAASAMRHESPAASISETQQPRVPPNPKSLQAAFEQIFQQDFSFPDQFHKAIPLVGCPNPQLIVNGIGQLDFPLGERKATDFRIAVTNNTQHSPFGNSVLELSETQVAINNPAWNEYLEETLPGWLFQDILPRSCHPRIEFRGLKMWSPSSTDMHYILTVLENATQSNFASMAIIMPSQYTGGLLEFDQQDMHRVRKYDLGAISPHPPTAVFWYDGVTATSSALTSGYRIALCYRVHHNSPGSSPSFLYMQEKLNSLHVALAHWTRMRSRGLDLLPTIIAYSLHSNPRDVNQRPPFTRILKHLMAMCGEYGIRIMIGRLEAASGKEVSPDSLLEICIDEPRVPFATITNLTDANAQEPQSVASLQKIRLYPPDILCTNLRAANLSVDHYATLVLYHEQCVDWISIKNALHDPEKALDAYVDFLYCSLDRKQTRQPAHLEMLERHARDYLLQRIVNDLNAGTSSPNSGAPMLLARHAICRNDLAFWERLVEVLTRHCTSYFLAILNNLCWTDAWKQFSFASVEPTLKNFWQLLTFHESIEAVLDVGRDADLLVLREKQQHEVIRDWCVERLREKICARGCLREADASRLFDLLKIMGERVFVEFILPPLAKLPDCSFWRPFTKEAASCAALQGKLLTFCCSRLQKEFTQAIRSTTFQPKALMESLESAEIFLRLGRNEQLLSSLLHPATGQNWPTDELLVAIEVFFVPLIPALFKMVMNIDSSLLPKFHDFFHLCICRFLSCHAAPKTVPNIRSVSGGAERYDALDDFIYSNDLDEGHFYGDLTELQALTDPLILASDMLTYSWQYFPNETSRIEVRKNMVPNVDSARHLRKARGIFAKVGTPVTMQLFAHRYRDAAATLTKGTRFVHRHGHPFQSTPTLPEGCTRVIYRFAHGQWVAVLGEIGF